MKFRHLDPSILPGESEAREAEFLTIQGQAQQQCVGQQGNQQRETQSPAFGAKETDRLPAGAGDVDHGHR